MKTLIFSKIIWAILVKEEFYFYTCTTTNYRRIWTTYLTQRYDNWDFDETSTTGFRYIEQLMWWKQIRWTCCNKNNYNADFVKRNTHRTTEPNETNRNPTPVTTATIARIGALQYPRRPQTTLPRHLLTNVEDKDEPLTTDREQFTRSTSLTVRNLNMRLTEHKLATRNGRIDWDSAECITCCTNYFQRLTLENWDTNLERTPLKPMSTTTCTLRTTNLRPNKTDDRKNSVQIE